MRRTHARLVARSPHKGPRWSTPANPGTGAAAAKALQDVISTAPDNLSGYPQFLNPDKLSGIGMAWALLYFGNRTEAEKHLAPLLDLPDNGGCYHAFESISRYYLYTKALPIAHDVALYMSSSVFNAESLKKKDALVKAAEWVFTNNISAQVPHVPNFGTGCSINFGTGGAAARWIRTPPPYTQASGLASASSRATQIGTGSETIQRSTC